MGNKCCGTTSSAINCDQNNFDYNSEFGRNHSGKTIRQSLKKPRNIERMKRQIIEDPNSASHLLNVNVS